MKRTRFMARHRTDGAGKIIGNTDDSFRLPVFKSDICNPDSADEMIVQRADDKVFNIIPAFHPFTRRLIKFMEGWDGKKKK